MHGVLLAVAFCCQTAEVQPGAQQYGPVEVFWETTQQRWAEGQKIIGDPYGRYHVTQWRDGAQPPGVVSPSRQPAEAPDFKPPKAVVKVADRPLDIVGSPDKEVSETLAPVETTVVEGYGACEARKILKSTDEPSIGKYRIVRQIVPPQPLAPPQPPAATSDPYGFMQWLNSTRASYGLGAVGYDQNLSNWAALNNTQQLSQGLGHFIMGPARRQNAAMGSGFPGAMWMASDGHRAALLDPTISWFGIAAAGAYWTWNAY